MLLRCFLCQIHEFIATAKFFHLIIKLRIALILLFALFILMPFQLMAENTPHQSPDIIHLIVDPQFHNGVEILNPEQGAIVVEDKVQPPWYTTEKPDWTLRQWDSRYTLAESEPQYLDEGSIRIEDTAKWVIFGAPDSAYADIVLGMDSRKEWGDTPRERGQPWPHLLLGQDTANQSPTIAEMASVDFRISARLLQGERFEHEHYHTSVHAAEFTVFLTLQNRNQESIGYGDFLWFGIQLYDDRHRMTPERLIEGDAGHRKFIYQPGLAPYTDKSFHDGEWITIQKDLLPLFIDAFEKAWERGFLPGSKDLSDYRIGRLGLGWEVPGMNLVEMQIRDLQCDIRVNIPVELD